MQYHISTGLIIKHFEENCGCPLCTIEKIVESNICRELLADGCMDDDVRMEVNAKGFCEKHFDQLFQMTSKLGLALQITTRMDTLFKKAIKEPKNVRDAKKQGKILDEEQQKCIVCDYTEKEMVKYYKTIAQLYSNEEQFINLFTNCEGFCLKHYSKLLQYSDYAYFSAKKYLDALYAVESKRLNQSVEYLKAFATRHDYRNLGKPLGEAANALPRIKTDLFGKK
ncbi:MAG: hypothetical protein IJA15_01960 [Clostridia bacterium]|nr:hypothetical protein [Clostridia bacterium]